MLTKAWTRRIWRAVKVIAVLSVGVVLFSATTAIAGAVISIPLFFVVIPAAYLLGRWLWGKHINVEVDIND